MADSTAFETLCDELEARSALDRLEARGTIRLALKKAGLDARTVSPDQLQVVIDRLLTTEFESRGIDGAEALCSDLRESVAQVQVDRAGSETPEAVFARLGS